MKAWIITSGPIDISRDFRETIQKERPEAVICADGGIDNAKCLGIRANIVIGDMDSVQDKNLEGLTVIKYPPEKDKTDTQLAVEYALENGYNDITILTVLGGMMGHSLANILLLKYIAERGGKGRILTQNSEVFFLRDEIKLCNNGYRFFSLLPLTSEVRGVTTEGAKYPLNSETLYIGDTRGISNEFIEESAKITITKGEMLVIVDR